MDKNSRAISDNLIFALIFMAALFVRLLQLGKVPLLESEAGWAVQALRLARGEQITLGSQVGYLAVSRALFTLFGSSTFLARLWPAVVGSLVVWIPFWLRKELGRLPALVMAAGLALDPGLVSTARLAGGPVPAVMFFFLALVSFHEARISWAVFWGGLGLLSGPDFWLGILLGAVWLGLLSAVGWWDPSSYFHSRLAAYRKGSDRILNSLLLPFLLLVLIGSIFMTDLQGLSAWVSAFPEFLSAWMAPAGLPEGKMALALLISNPLALVFGLLGLLSSWRGKNPAGKLLSAWLAVSLLVLSVYPDRQAEDLIWMAVPLWWCAAAEIARIARAARWGWAAYLMGGLVAVLLVLNWLTFIGMVFQAGNDRAFLLQLGLLAASVALIVLSMTIIFSEWGRTTAWQGLAAGLGLALALFMVSSLTLDAYRWDKDPRSLYASEPGPGQMDLLRDSISSASLSLTGRPDSIEGVVVEDSDSLRWALRDYSGVHFDNSLDLESLPALLITSQGDTSPGDGEQYRGQDFVLSTDPGWTGSLPPDWISWVAYRFGPVEPRHIILWIRNDINSGY